MNFVGQAFTPVSPHRGRLPAVNNPSFLHSPPFHSEFDLVSPTQPLHQYEMPTYSRPIFSPPQSQWGPCNSFSPSAPTMTASPIHVNAVPYVNSQPIQSGLLRNGPIFYPRVVQKPTINSEIFNVKIQRGKSGEDCETAFKRAASRNGITIKEPPKQANYTSKISYAPKTSDTSKISDTSIRNDPFKTNNTCKITVTSKTSDLSITSNTSKTSNASKTRATSKITVTSKTSDLSITSDTSKTSNASKTRVTSITCDTFKANGSKNLSNSTDSSASITQRQENIQPNSASANLNKDSTNLDVATDKNNKQSHQSLCNLKKDLPQTEADNSSLIYISEDEFESDTSEPKTTNLDKQDNGEVLASCFSKHNSASSTNTTTCTMPCESEIEDFIQETIDLAVETLLQEISKMTSSYQTVIPKDLNVIEDFQTRKNVQLEMDLIHRTEDIIASSNNSKKESVQSCDHPVREKLEKQANSYDLPLYKTPVKSQDSFDRIENNVLTSNDHSVKEVSLLNSENWDDIDDDVFVQTALQKGIKVGNRLPVSNKKLVKTDVIESGDNFERLASENGIRIGSSSSQELLLLSNEKTKKKDCYEDMFERFASKSGIRIGSSDQQQSMQPATLNADAQDFIYPQVDLPIPVLDTLPVSAGAFTTSCVNPVFSPTMEQGKQLYSQSANAFTTSCVNPVFSPTMEHGKQLYSQSANAFTTSCVNPVFSPTMEHGKQLYSQSANAFTTSRVNPVFSPTMEQGKQLYSQSANAFTTSCVNPVFSPTMEQGKQLYSQSASAFSIPSVKPVFSPTMEQGKRLYNQGASAFIIPCVKPVFSPTIEDGNQLYSERVSSTISHKTKNDFTFEQIAKTHGIRVSPTKADAGCQTDKHSLNTQACQTVDLIKMKSQSIQVDVDKEAFNKEFNTWMQEELNIVDPTTASFRELYLSEVDARVEAERRLEVEMDENVKSQRNTKMQIDEMKEHLLTQEQTIEKLNKELKSTKKQKDNEIKKLTKDTKQKEEDIINLEHEIHLKDVAIENINEISSDQTTRIEELEEKIKEMENAMDNERKKNSTFRVEPKKEVPVKEQASEWQIVKGHSSNTKPGVRLPYRIDSLSGFEDDNDYEKFTYTNNPYAHISDDNMSAVQSPEVTSYQSSLDLRLPRNLSQESETNNNTLLLDNTEMIQLGSSCHSYNSAKPTSSSESFLSCHSQESAKPTSSSESFLSCHSQGSAKPTSSSESFLSCHSQGSDDLTSPRSDSSNIYRIGSPSPTLPPQPATTTVSPGSSFMETHSTTMAGITGNTLTPFPSLFSGLPPMYLPPSLATAVNTANIGHVNVPSKSDIPLPTRKIKPVKPQQSSNKFFDAVMEILRDQFPSYSRPLLMVYLNQAKFSYGSTGFDGKEISEIVKRVSQVIQKTYAYA